MKGGAGLVGALLLVSALGVARTQPRLAKTSHDAKEQDEVYALPPPAQLKLFALGYDAATVDLLWAKLLVEFGMHWHEKREFHADPYVDAVLYLEPTYDRTYRFADTLLCYHPLHGTEGDARKARAVLERGTRERPGDFEVWQEYGQFSAFLGPSFLPAEAGAERDAWRRDGALAMAKAVELGAPGSGALIAATLLNRSGERHAALESLERRYAANDDPDERAQIAAKIGRLQNEQENEEARERFAAEEKALRTVDSLGWTEWPFLSKTQLLLLGPFPPAAQCVGVEAEDDPACALTWGDLIATPTAQER